MKCSLLRSWDLSSDIGYREPVGRPISRTMHMVLSRCPNFGLVNALGALRGIASLLKIEFRYEIGTKTTHVGAGIFSVMPAGNNSPFCWSIL